MWLLVFGMHFFVFCIFYAIHKFLGQKIFVVISCIIELILLALSKFGPEMLDNIMGISCMARYFPCFIAGAIIKQYEIKHIGKAIGSLLLIIFCVAYAYRGVENTSINMALQVVRYFSFSLFFFYFIKYVENEMPVFVRDALSYVGKKSLAIYIVHFYFVDYLIQRTGYVCIDFAVMLIISLIVIALSLAVERIHVKMTYLDRIF